MSSINDERILHSPLDETHTTVHGRAVLLAFKPAITRMLAMMSYNSDRISLETPVHLLRALGIIPRDETI